MARQPFLRPDDDDDDREIADVSGLFRDDSRLDRPRSSGSRPHRRHDLDSYDLADEPETELDTDLDPAPPRQGPRSRTDRLRIPGSTLDEDEAREAVEQVWSRWGEWWPTLLSLLVAASALIWLLVETFSPEDLGRSFLLLVIGAASLLVLSYPILITLERPVRITPEQAVQDYYEALSHWIPHYRRMWLLLSKAGRESSEFQSYGQFKRYWKGRLSRLRSRRGLGVSPLVFKVAQFRSEKSVGKSVLDARYQIQVFRATGQDADPHATYSDQMTLVRGPDRMWYLGKGTLPEDAADAETS
jgi:hypothetical protein